MMVGVEYVGLFINSNFTYVKRDDPSVFTPHVIESVFFEIQINERKTIIVGVVYREPWVTNGILTSSLTKSKLLKKKLKKPTEQNINAFKKYCIIFDKVKKMAKESYFNLELELNKNNLKKNLGNIASSYT